MCYKSVYVFTVQRISLPTSVHGERAYAYERRDSWDAKILHELRFPARNGNGCLPFFLSPERDSASTTSTKSCRRGKEGSAQTCNGNFLLGENELLPCPNLFVVVDLAGFIKGVIGENLTTKEVTGPLIFRAVQGCGKMMNCMQNPFIQILEIKVAVS